VKRGFIFIPRLCFPSPFSHLTPVMVDIRGLPNPSVGVIVNFVFTFATIVTCYRLQPLYNYNLTGPRTRVASPS